MRTLRAPEGCPWDREQTQASLRPFVLEETYEVLEAIESGSPAQLCEELGDFLFEAVFLAQISDERGEFTIADAIDAICDKLVRRHPHVFARDEGDPVADQRSGHREVGDAEGARARGGGPAGEEAQDHAERRAEDAAVTAARVRGERACGGGRVRLGEGRRRARQDRRRSRGAAAAKSSRARPAISSRAEEEMGDLLFAIANLSRKLGIEPEAALRRANDKFTSRFDAVEQAFTARNQSMSDATLEEMEAEWQRVKASS